MLKKMVLAIDASDFSKRAVKVASELAGKLDAEVVVLHVEEKTMGHGGAYTMETNADAHDLVEKVTKELKDAGLSARGVIHPALHGHTAHAIVELADAEAADLVVLGTRGLSDLAGIMVGSVTHKLLQITHTPVLVAR
jgi:nucleotide-binding universal stress UspA family protein